MAFRIEHRIGVAAPASEIWDLVCHLEGWKDWNPVYSSASGEIAIGGVLNFTLNLADRPPMSLKGAVYDWVPEHQLAWTLKFAGGLVTTLRYIEIESLGPTSCILANGEYYQGLGAPLISKAMRSDIKAAMRQMNEALAKRSQAAWIAKGGEPAVSQPDAEGLTTASMKPLQPTVGRSAPWGFSKRKAGSMGLSK